MSVRVMTAVWSLDLPDSEKIVLLALADCANDDGHCWPGMMSLSRKCSKSERTIQGAIRGLCEKGHLTRQEAPGRGCNYYVHPRSDCAPAETAPPQRTSKPPQPLRPTPAAAAGKPSENHQNHHLSTDVDSSSADEPPLRPEEVFQSYQGLAESIGLKVPRDLTPERRQLIRGRISQYPLADFQDVFARCRGSPFLRGDKGRTPLTIDWVMKKANFQKVLEGNYDD